MAFVPLRSFNSTPSFHVTAKYTFSDRDLILQNVFNTRAQTWSLNIFLPDGEALLRSRRVIANIDLLAPFHQDERFFPGVLRVVDLSGVGKNPGALSFARNTHRYEYDDGT